MTSVTLDRTKEVALVYHNALDAGELKGRIYGMVQAACDDIQDEAGRPRFVVRGEHGAYLDDGDDDGGDDFFGAAGANALAKQGGLYAGEQEESADALAAKRDASQAAGGGWFSWLRW